jgi:hypothetical protein
VPFERTAAFRKYGTLLEPAPGAPEDLYTKEILREQGFDGLPHVVSQEELDGFVAAGEVELFRGVSDAGYGDQFRYGDLFVGRGIYGGGVYAAGGPDGFEVAQTFAEGPGGAILRMNWKVGARIADARLLRQTAERQMLRALMELDGRERRALRRAIDPAARVDLRSTRALYNEKRLAIYAEYGRIGRYAAHRGFDGLHNPVVATYFILNRTAVRVQKEDLS